MKKINFKRDILPHLIAVVVFYLVTVVFFSPAIFENKTLSQHDITQAAGGSKELQDYYDETGEVALWTNSMFSGMPTYLMGVSHFGDVMVHVHKAFGLFLPQPVRLLFISFLSLYIMLLCFGVRPWLAIAGGLAFGLTGFSMIGMMAGHNSKIAAVAYMPLVFGGVHLAFKRKLVWGFALTALGMALELRANHLQITYFLLLIVLLYGLSQLIVALKEKRLPRFGKTVGILVLAVVLGVGANLGRILTVMEYGNYSTRGKSELTRSDKASGLDKDYAFQYSNGIFEPLFLFIPNFYGGSSQQDLGKDSNLEQALRRNGIDRQQAQAQASSAPTYWGDQPITAPYYAGSIVVFLFVLSLFVLETRFTGWIIAAVIMGIMMSWGKNFSAINDLLFDYLPGLNKFRSVTFAIIIPVFVMILSGFVGLEKTLSTTWDKAFTKKFLIALGITGGFALLCVLFAGMGSYRGAIDERLAGYPDWFIDALRKDRASLLRGDAFRSLMFVASFATVIYFAAKQKLSGALASGIMVLLVLIDMFGVSKRFINEDNFVRSSRSEFSLTEADQQILKDNGHYRVFNLANPFNDGVTSYYHNSIGGYHGAKMGRYQHLIEYHLSDEHSRAISSLREGNMNFSGLSALNMLNAKYFKAGAEARAVIPNQDANGNAWFVQSLKKVDNPDEEIDAIGGMNTGVEAVVDQSKFEIGAFAYDSLSNIRMNTYSPNEIVYQSESSVNSLAVFSEVYYPEGWTAFIDGKELPIHRVNFVLRALEIPSGSHEIKFIFKPDAYYIGNNVALVSSILLLLLALGAIVNSFRPIISIKSE